MIWSCRVGLVAQRDRSSFSFRSFARCEGCPFTPVVGDGGPVGEAPKIGRNVPGTCERGLGADHPVLPAQRGLQTLELATVGAAEEA